MRAGRILDLVILAALASAGASAGSPWASPSPGGVAARLVLADGSVRDGLVFASDAASLALRGPGPTAVYPLGAVRIVSFVAAADYQLDRARVAPRGHTLVLRNGKSAAGWLEAIDETGVLWRSSRSRKTARFSIDTVKRVYLDPAATDTAAASAPPDGGAIDPRSRAILATAAQETRALQQRLLATAHHGERFERQAVARLAALEAALAALDLELAAPRLDRDRVASATGTLVARAAEVGQAMDALDAYESVRARWAELSDLVLPEAIDEIKKALRSAR